MLGRNVYRNIYRKLTRPSDPVVTSTRPCTGGSEIRIGGDTRALICFCKGVFCLGSGRKIFGISHPDRGERTEDCRPKSEVRRQTCSRLNHRQVPGQTPRSDPGPRRTLASVGCTASRDRAPDRLSASGDPDISLHSFPHKW